MSATIDHPRLRVGSFTAPTARLALKPVARSPGDCSGRTTTDRVSGSLKQALEKTKDAFRRNGSGTR